MTACRLAINVVVEMLTLDLEIPSRSASVDWLNSQGWRSSASCRERSTLYLPIVGGAASSARRRDVDET
jgi:hypothetical protein